MILEQALNKVQSEIEKGLIVVGHNSNYTKEESLKLINNFNGDLWTQGIVGVFKTELIYEDKENQTSENFVVQVVIKSRFDRDGNKPYFLAKMFESTELDISEHLSECSYDELFEFLLVSLFKSKFIEASQNGFFKQYITMHADSSKPKGVIDFNEYIKRVGLNEVSIPYSFRERTVDNSINRLIISAYRSLKRNFAKHVENIIDSTDIKKTIDFLANELSYFSDDARKIMKDANKQITHPMFNNYEQLRLLSLRILRQEGVSPFKVENDETEAILYYIPDLWEKYIEKELIGRYRFDYFYIKAQETLRVLNNHLTIRPDFVLYNNLNTPIGIFDAKFKRKWSEERFDLDDYSKCIRDMNAFNAHHTGVIFPSEIKSENNILIDNISKFNTVDQFYRIVVFIPEHNGVSYYQYAKNLDLHVEDLAGEFNLSFSRNFTKVNIQRNDSLNRIAM